MPFGFGGASLAAQMVEYLSAMQETWVWSMGQEDPLEKGIDTHSSILAWRVLWTGEPDRLQSMGSQESDTTEQLQYYRFSTFPSPFYLSYIAFLIFVQLTVHSNEKTKKNESCIFSIILLVCVCVCVCVCVVVDISYNTRGSGIALINSLACNNHKQ